MKKLFSIVFPLLTFINVSYCQIIDNVEWAPQGATWMYGNVGFGAYYHLITYERDTLIEFKQCKIFSSKERVFDVDQDGSFYFLIEHPKSNFILHKSHDSVFLVDPTLMNFQLMYAFNLVPGDMYELNENTVVYDNCDQTPSTNYLVISDTGNDTVSGRVYNYQEYFDPPYWTVGSRVLRNIGSLNSFLPQPKLENISNCMFKENEYHHYTERLLCYYDNQRGSSSFYHGYSDSQCNTYLFTDVSVNENDLVNNEIYIYPNPTNSSFQLSYPAGESVENIEFFDVAGRLVFKHNKPQFPIYIAYVTPGIYYVKYQFETGKSGTLKMIKN